MKIYYAPLEGITNSTFRNTHAKYYQGIDKYFAPFVSPSSNYTLKGKELNELLPENNHVPYLVPQILSKNADETNWCIKEIHKLGYQEINLNLGCPAPTIVKRGRGSAMLQDLTKLEAYLDEIFIQNPKGLSIKTRIGFDDVNQAKEIIQLYNKYPLEELIVHPRSKADLYHKPIHYELLNELYTISHHTFIYNGDINTIEDLKYIQSIIDVDKIMIGRGLLINPGLSDKIKNIQVNTSIYDYIDSLKENYLSKYKDEHVSLCKLKEVWAHLSRQFPDKKKELKQLRKSQTISQYEEAVRLMFEK